MELLSPAGNLEKLNIAFAYGADAIYMGLPGFSLRAGAESWEQSDIGNMQQIIRKWQNIRPRKVYLTINRYLHQKDIESLEKLQDQIGLFPFDAFIISDLGFVKKLKTVFPNTELHLSTQANCTNSEAARMYADLGFTRIVAARELGLDEIADIKSRIPEMEIEVFVHGAVCIAYSGRCLISSWLTGRSANHGECTHSCRWQYREFEEKKRPGNPIRVIEDGDYSTIFSPEDMRMINHLEELEKAGVDSVKIEGRMKSAYYLAAVTQAYRAGIDHLHQSADSTYFNTAKKLLETLPHRGYSTGMYFGKPEIEVQPSENAPRFMGMILPGQKNNLYPVEIKNRLSADSKVFVLSPEIPEPYSLEAKFIDESGPVESLYHGKKSWLESTQFLPEYSLLISAPTLHDA
ncbi:peptidase U32 family protein [Spirochaeta dissipatitropha]